MAAITIRDIRTILTAPAGIDLLVVKVETSEPGLYGLGCATFTQRYSAVQVAVDEYLKPLLVGKDVHNIEDCWQLAMSSSYWRNGPVLNNAISGVDEALWDIKGKLAGMPVYQLLGGKCREGAAVYRHAGGETYEQVEQQVRGFMQEGYRYVRCQAGSYGGHMAGKPLPSAPEGAPDGDYFDPKLYMEDTIGLLAHLRAKLGNEVELIHDVHERLYPADALWLAKQLEPYKLYFLEDALPPEQQEWLASFRSQTSVPLALGELFNHPLEWKSLVSGRLIDFIRVHISQIGGLTPARKLANFCEVYNVRTAWHGPKDLSPVGVAVQLHLDLAIPNFGIQEFSGFTDEEKAVFPGCPEARGGYLYANDKPGLGIDIDEEAAAQYECRWREHGWLRCRLPDGTVIRP